MELPECFELGKQIAGFWFFSFLWYTFGCVGSDPIRAVNPTVIVMENLESASHTSNWYHVMWWWLYMVVCTHMTIALQVAHATH